MCSLPNFILLHGVMGGEISLGGNAVAKPMRTMTRLTASMRGALLRVVLLCQRFRQLSSNQPHIVRLYGQVFS